MNIRKDRIIFCFFFILFVVGLGYFLSKYSAQITTSDFPVKNMGIVFFVFSPFLFWSLHEIVRLLNLKKSKYVLVFLLIFISFLLIPSSPFVLKYGLKYGELKCFKATWILCSCVLGLVPFLISNKYIYVNEFLQDNIRFVSFLRLWIGFLSFWSSLFFVVVFHAWKVVVLALSSAFISDTIAYLFGKFARIRIFSSSPNKTLEGFLASIIITPIVLFVNWKYSLGQLNSLGLFIVISIMPIFANMGDLFFSKQKRLIGIKDFGNIFLGHGGFWDRFDSHCFSLSIFSLFSCLLTI